MNENEHGIVLLSEFIDKFQREVSFINNGIGEDLDSINDTFNKAYKCLFDFVQERKIALDFVITPLSTSLLGSISKGIMIPDVPIGIVVNSVDNHDEVIYRERHQKLLQYILCYIGIVNVLETISLSGIVKSSAERNPTRLYGHITYDAAKNATQIYGLDSDETPACIDWNEQKYNRVLKELTKQYDEAEDLISEHHRNSEGVTYEISSKEYESIKHRISSNSHLSEIGENYDEKRTCALASHLFLCQKAGLCSSYYFFNPPFILDSNGHYVNYGNIVITVNKRLSRVWEQILFFFSLQLLSAYRIHFQKRIESELLRSHQKSAKAAIMSRNMSHNLGSHVMAYLKQHLSSVTSMLQDNVLSQLFTSRLFSSDDGIRKLIGILELGIDNPEKMMAAKNRLEKVSEQIALPFLVGLGQFVSYLQERQDFIATIATDYIPYYSTVNFKDFVYDELNPDKRYERHQDRKNLRLDNILLGNIARSEGLGRPTSPTVEDGGKMCDIILRFEDFDGSPCTDSDSPEYVSLQRLRRFNVSLPGGIVGRQAIFSIIENVIRNAAKHGNWREAGKLELTLRKYVLNDSFPDDRVGNHRSLKEVINDFYADTLDIDDLFIVTLTDNTKSTESHLDTVRKALREDYVNEYGIMNSGNKGLKEMRISAAWIRSIKDEDECVKPFLNEKPDHRFRKEHLAPLFYARLSADEYFDEEAHLQYVFCLPKPKVLCIVSDSLAMNPPVEESWSDCRFLSRSDYEKEKNKSYEFILCEDSYYDSLRFVSSSRLFSFSDVAIPQEASDYFKDNNCADLLNNLYNKLSGYESGERIFIDDDKTFSYLQNAKGPFKQIVIGPGGHEEFAQGTYMTRGQVFVSDGVTCGKYIYRKHHDTYEQFSSFMEKGLDVAFVEGITGNNSTDRFVRNEDLNDIWFHRHLHAMKQKVAICDERIFSKVFGLEETSFTRGKVRKATDLNLTEIKEYYAGMVDSQEMKNCIHYINRPDYLNQFVDTELKERLQVSRVFSQGIMGASFIQKGVFAFTLIQDVSDMGCFHLVGAIMEDAGRPVLKNRSGKEYECQCAYLADLKWDDQDGLDMRPCPDAGGEYCLQGYFNSCSIHQGLLDKLYEGFGFEKKDSKKKILLTAQLYEYFIGSVSKTESDIKERIENKKLVFLPGMMIHSGRSRPGEDDMPQRVPFIQYAALEHAVMDCKYSVVELLDHARYELP